MLKMFTLGLVLGISTANALSQTPSDIQAPSDGNAYLQNSQGTISRSQHGLCWRTGHWTPADAVTGCDGELVPPIAKPTAPAIAPSLSVAQAPAVPTQCDFSITLNNEQTFDFNKGAINRFNQAVKDALDPNGILAPGKQGIWPTTYAADRKMRGPAA